ncbi:hypothetical protein NDU88_003115 [Pleurodeles waltl]|uniref:Uncharacterized protein n=1 Tax=Pleurodeles waltl TaxID=8319 RepID=A0AAV7TQ35_PLEWA|nr:hypothetical protein NDU88_003115 [Pleurodeles waltl]
MTCPALTWVDDLYLEDDLRLDKMPWVLTEGLLSKVRKWFVRRLHRRVDQTTRQSSGTCPTQHDPLSLKGCGPPAEPHHTAAPSSAAIPAATTAILALVPRWLAARGETRRRHARTVPALCSPLLAPASARDPLHKGSPPTDKHTGARDARRWCFASASAVRGT